MAIVGLATVTCLVLISGNIDVAGQALLASGLYAIWCLWDATITMVCAGANGVITSHDGNGISVFCWPHRIYCRCSSTHRLARARNVVAAVPRSVRPSDFPNCRKRSCRICMARPAPGASAWCLETRSRVRPPCTWLVLNPPGRAPGMVQSKAPLVHPVLLDSRFPCAELVSECALDSRFSALAGFENDVPQPPRVRGILGDSGAYCDWLQSLRRGEVSRRRWFLLPRAVLAALRIWCVLRTIHLPYPVASAQAVTIQASFIRSYTVAGILCGLRVIRWVLLSTRHVARSSLVPSL